MITHRSLPSVPTTPSRCTTFIPFETRPKIVCLPSRNGVGASVMKNWLPFVLGPLRSKGDRGVRRVLEGAPAAAATNILPSLCRTRLSFQAGHQLAARFKPGVARPLRSRRGSAGRPLAATLEVTQIWVDS